MQCDTATVGGSLDAPLHAMSNAGWQCKIWQVYRCCDRLTPVGFTGVRLPVVAGCLLQQTSFQSTSAASASGLETEPPEQLRQAAKPPAISPAHHGQLLVPPSSSASERGSGIASTSGNSGLSSRPVLSGSSHYHLYCIHRGLHLPVF